MPTVIGDEQGSVPWVWSGHPAAAGDVRAGCPGTRDGEVADVTFMHSPDQPCDETCHHDTPQPSTPSPPEHDINCGIDPLHQGEDIGCTCHVQFERADIEAALPEPSPGAAAADWHAYLHREGMLVEDEGKECGPWHHRVFVGAALPEERSSETPLRGEPSLDVDALTDIIEQAIFETDTGLAAAILAADRIVARLGAEKGTEKDYQP